MGRNCVMYPQKRNVIPIRSRRNVMMIMKVPNNKVSRICLRFKKILQMIQGRIRKTRSNHQLPVKNSSCNQYFISNSAILSCKDLTLQNSLSFYPWIYPFIMIYNTLISILLFEHLVVLCSSLLPKKHSQ